MATLAVALMLVMTVLISRSTHASKLQPCQLQISSTSKPVEIVLGSEETAASRLWMVLGNIANMSIALKSGHNMTDVEGDAAGVLKEIQKFVLAQNVGEMYAQFQKEYPQIKGKQTLGSQTVDTNQTTIVKVLDDSYIACAICGGSIFIVIEACLDCFN